MLKLVKTKPKFLSDYRKIVRIRTVLEIRYLARKLKGKKVVHINATPIGGGVYEILRSLVPLMRSSGLNAQWYSLSGDNQDFFKVTKEFHNALQGKKVKLPQTSKNLYLKRIKTIASSLNKIKADYWIIHDPQVLALIDYIPHGQKAIWRCHIDTSHPNLEYWRFLEPFIKKYNRVIFSLKDYVHGGIDKNKIKIVQPAIDPLLSKNALMSKRAARDFLKKLSIDPKRPLVAQISRFDPWKDPEGVVKAYQLAKKKIPKLQLAYFGLKIAKDDPEADLIYRRTNKIAGGDPDIHLIFDPKVLGNYPFDNFIRASQSAADIILQKSTREGFGLTVTEGMWKSKPVIGGNVGGIRLQIRNGYNGYLVGSIEECADKIVLLLSNNNLRKKISSRAKKSVKKKFLITRLLRDYLKILSESD